MMDEKEKNILLIDAAVTADSRTRRLAEAVTERMQGNLHRLILGEEGLSPLTGEVLTKRDSLREAEDYDDPMFDYAHMVAEADNIVIAAPYWDLSFPASLKVFVEHVCAKGITFLYAPQGYPIGLCRAENLYYVTTSGGYTEGMDFGYEYIDAVFGKMFGVKNIKSFRAEGLDIEGNDPEKILKDAIDSLPEEL